MRLDYLIELHGTSNAEIKKIAQIYTKKFNEIKTGKVVPDHKTFEQLLEIFKISEEQFWGLNVRDDFTNDSLTVGKRIQFFRREKGLTTTQLDRKLMLSANILTKYERGYLKPQQESFKVILDALDVDLEKFWEIALVDLEDVVKARKKKSKLFFNPVGSSDYDSSKFIEQFKQYKKYRSFSSASIACLLDVHLQDILDLENGLVEPSERLFKTLFKIFEVDEAEFWGEVGEAGFCGEVDFLNKPKKIKNDFSKIINLIRAEKGLDRSEFAKYLGLTLGQIYSYESDSNLPTALTFEDILKKLSLSEKQFWNKIKSYPSKSDLNQCGQKIKYYRKCKSIKANELSKISQVSKSTIYNLENGRRLPDLYYIYKLIKAMKIKYKDFWKMQLPNEKA